MIEGHTLSIDLKGNTFNDTTFKTTNACVDKFECSKCML
jgi:hypothetical protein